MAWQSVLGLDESNSLEDGLAGSNLTHVAARPALGLAKRTTQKTSGYPRFAPSVTAAKPHVAAESSTLVGSEGQQKQKRCHSSRWYQLPPLVLSTVLLGETFEMFEMRGTAMPFSGMKG